VASRGAGHKIYSITGDAVKLASRLTDAAPAGVILVSDAVRHMLPPRFTCAEGATLAVKGLGEPVRAWRLIGVGDAAAKRLPFVGRQAELAQFRGVLGACRETGAGQAVVVRGDAGIGKTRVVEELQALAARAGFACHVALVLDFGAGTGEDAIHALVRGLLGLTTGSAPAAARTAAQQAVAHGLVADDQLASRCASFPAKQPALRRKSRPLGGGPARGGSDPSRGSRDQSPDGHYLRRSNYSRCARPCAE
jgi:AAA ATPase domain